MTPLRCFQRNIQGIGVIDAESRGKTFAHVIRDFLRATFGDERADYAAALDEHYLTLPTTWDAERFVSAYATSHPFEDWAETFASYLQLLDLVDTAVARGLIDDHAGELQGRPGRLHCGEQRRGSERNLYCWLWDF